MEYQYITTREELETVVQLLIQYPVLAVDTETNGLDIFNNDLLLIQLSVKPDFSYIIDARKIGYTVCGEYLKNLFSDQKIIKILQNAKFDYKFIKAKLGIELVNVYDTMLAERTLTAGLGDEVKLPVIVEKYCKAYMSKEERNSFIGHKSNSFTEEQLKYAALDISYLFQIRDKQLVLLQANNLELTAHLEFRCAPSVGDLEINGVLLDGKRWVELIEQTKEQLKIEHKVFMDMIPGGVNIQKSLFDDEEDKYSVNINSNKQLLKIFRKMGIDLADTAKETLAQRNEPQIKQLLAYRALEKTASSFGYSVLDLRKADGRIHPDFIQYGADTGRFSCSNPNVQQIPAKSDFRDCFIAPEGSHLITVDYSQCELRILAELSGDKEFRRAFEEKKDLHIYAASMMFGVPESEVNKFQRGAAKAINFGLMYGMGAGGLARRIDKTTQESAEIIKSYFSAFTGVASWLQQAGEFGKANLYAETLIHRKRFFKRPDKSSLSRDEYNERMASIERQSKNHPVQGTNADVTKFALVFLKEALKDKPAKIVNCVHDEIVVEVKDGYQEEVSHIVEYQMVRAGKKVLKNVETVAEATISDKWRK